MPFQTHVVAPPGSLPAVLIGGRPGRYALIIQPSGGQPMWVSPVSPVAESNGLYLVQNNILFLKYCDVGDMCEAQWYVVGNLITSSIFVIECYN